MHVRSATYPGQGEHERNDGGLSCMIAAGAAHLVAGLRLSGKLYRLVRHAPLPTGSGTAEIERIIVSPFGVFVVDTKHMKGRIFGDAEQKAWVRHAGKQQQAFANPLHAAQRQARMVAAMVGIDAGKVFPVVAFAGGVSFASTMPKNVTRAGGYARYIKSKRVQVLTKSEVNRIVQLLEDRIAYARQSEAAEATKSCPSCGRDMVQRDAKRGDAAGKRFWVCSDFPTCRTAIELRPEPSPMARPAPEAAPTSTRSAAPRPAARIATRPAAAPAPEAGGEFGRPVWS